MKAINLLYSNYKNDLNSLESPGVNSLKAFNKLNVQKINNIKQTFFTEVLQFLQQEIVMSQLYRATNFFQCSKQTILFHLNLVGGTTKEATLLLGWCTFYCDCHTFRLQQTKRDHLNHVYSLIPCI